MSEAADRAVKAIQEHFEWHPRSDPAGIAHNAVAVLLRDPQLLADLAATPHSREENQ